MKQVIVAVRISLLLLLAATLCACFKVSRVGKPLNLDDLIRSPLNTVGERFLSSMPESQVPFYLFEQYRSENLVRASRERTQSVVIPNYFDAVNKIIYTPSGDLRATTIKNNTYLRPGHVRGLSPSKPTPSDTKTGRTGISTRTTTR